jgi:acyl-CoA thioester hydrolase
MPADTRSSNAADPHGRPEFRFSHSLRVRWAEADMQGVVFNGHYLAYFDIGVTEYWRTLTGGDPQRLREIFDRLYVIKAVIEFHSPARFDDVLDVYVRTARLGGSSLRVLFEIGRGIERLISGENIYVFAEQGTAVRLPDAIRKSICNYEATAPEQ